MNRWLRIAAVAALACRGGSSPAPSAQGESTDVVMEADHVVVIAHTNDLHANFRPSSLEPGGPPIGGLLAIGSRVKKNLSSTTSRCESGQHFRFIAISSITNRTTRLRPDRIRTVVARFLSRCHIWWVPAGLRLAGSISRQPVCRYSRRMVRSQTR